MSLKIVQTYWAKKWGKYQSTTLILDWQKVCFNKIALFIPDEAIAGEDYEVTKGVLTFNPGETTKTFTVPIIGDTQPELDDFFTVYLLDPTSMNTDDPNILATTKGIIENDDTGFSKQSFDIAANSEIETIIGTLNLDYSPTLDDVEIPDDFITRRLTFSITDNVDPDNDGNLAFSLDGDRLLVNDSDDLDYETNPILNITIEASDRELTDAALCLD